MEAACRYLHTLVDIAHLLATINRDCLLSEQRRVDDTQLQYYTALVECYQGWALRPPAAARHLLLAG